MKGIASPIAGNADAARTTAKRIRLWALSAASVVVAAACGGGGDAGAPAFGPAPPSPNASSWSADQARKVASRTVNAMFVADEVATMAHTSSFGARTTGGVPLANFGARCTSGTGSGVFTDADLSNSITVGDFATYSLANCVIEPGSPWTFTGTPVARVTGGANIASFLLGGPGSFVVRWTANNTGFGAGRTIAGAWDTTLEVFSPGDVAGAVAMDALTLTLGPVSAGFTGVRFSGRGPNISALAGNITTTVANLGDVAVALSLPTALTFAASNSYRYQLTSGTVRLTAATWQLDVEYGAAGAVTLRLDEGKNGSVELTVNTTVAELDALLGTP